MHYDALQLRNNAIRRIKDLLAHVRYTKRVCCPEGHILYALIGRGGSVETMEKNVKALIQRYKDITHPVALSACMKRVTRILYSKPNQLYPHASSTTSQLVKNQDTIVQTIMADKRRERTMHESKECICFM